MMKLASLLQQRSDGRFSSTYSGPRQSCNVDAAASDWVLPVRFAGRARASAGNAPLDRRALAIDSGGVRSAAAFSDYQLVLTRRLRLSLVDPALHGSNASGAQLS